MMQVVFLGGASGVGASCLAIQLADQWIVVDAGVRTDRKANPLADPAPLEAHGPALRSARTPDRKRTRLNSSHPVNTYAVVCWKIKKEGKTPIFANLFR